MKVIKISQVTRNAFRNNADRALKFSNPEARMNVDPVQLIALLDENKTLIDLVLEMSYGRRDHDLPAQFGEEAAKAIREIRSIYG